MDAVFQERLIRHFASQQAVLSYLCTLQSNILMLPVLLLSEKHGV